MHVTVSDIFAHRHLFSGMRVTGRIRNTGKAEIGAGWDIEALFYAESGAIQTRANMSTWSLTGIKVGGSVAFSMYPVYVPLYRMLLEVRDEDGRGIPCNAADDPQRVCEWWWQQQGDEATAQLLPP